MRATRPEHAGQSFARTNAASRRRPGRQADGAALRARLHEGAAALGIDLSDSQASRLLAFVALLFRWNAVYNLTAIREPDRMVDMHLLDCLAAWPVLQALLDGLRPRGAQAPYSATVLDVGSGAGLPGLVWAVMLAEARPGATVTLVDAVDKKTAFQRQACAELGLGNLQCVHARIEQWESPPFDVVCSRAYATLADFIAGTHRLLGSGGRWLAMKGVLPEQEIAALPEGVVAERVVQLQVPGLDGAARCAIVLGQVGSVSACPAPPAG